MEIGTLLGLMAEHKASDVFLSAGAPPAIKINGETHYLEQPPLGAAQVHDLAYSVMNDRQQKAFEASLEMNLAIGLPDVGRFRVNIYRQRGTVAMAIRFITMQVPPLSLLNLPARIQDLVLIPRGLVLVVGATGSGKSTTLASMIDHRNQNRSGHILTIEDPIEFLHMHKKSIVDQREIGLDTLDYDSALKNAMRQAPDVILIGEIRDRATMQQAIAYAETGHLCLSTLHANNANQAIDRIVNFFPETARQQVLTDLSLNLRAVVSQRLLRGTDGKRVPAVELLLHTAYVADLIQKGEIDKLKDAMAQSVPQGMQTFDESLYQLYVSGRISLDEALSQADSRTDLSLRIRLHHGAVMPTDDLKIQVDTPTPRL